MKELTRAEEQIMQILWKRGKGFVKEIVSDFPDPKPAYNTVSTIVRILEKKKFVGYKAYGKSHEYFPVVEREQYTTSFGKQFIKNYFEGSFKEMVSFFARKENLGVNDIDSLLSDIKKDIENEKRNSDG
jgi:predicted transcriptional regulator